MARLGECFVRMQIEQITADDSDYVGEELRKHVYNPNEMNEPDLNLMNLFKPLADVVIEKTNSEDSNSLHAMQHNGQSIREKYSDIFHKIHPIKPERFRQILLQNSHRQDNTFNDRKKSAIQFQEVENVINAVCHPKTVDSACKLYLEQIQNETSKKTALLIN